MSDAALSLVERKKLQWAKEKEELAALGAPWNNPESNSKPFDRNPRRGSRRSSLPPLHKNQYNSYGDAEREIGCETSGYGSDNAPNRTPECAQTCDRQAGYESSSSIRDDRMKWGDKGVGKLWQPKEESVDNSDTSEPPNWVKRGLRGGEILVNDTSPAESPEQRYEDDRPRTGSSYSQNRNTFLRGQNIHIDSAEMAERERRRQLALAHQDAIRQQLEERDKRRREEKERRIKEEYEEELRIEREQELERKRKEYEQKLLQDKRDRERKRKEAIEEAIELAQKEAQLIKMRKNKINNINANINDHKNTESKFSDVVSKSEEIDNQEQLNNAKTIRSRSDSVNNDINNNLEIRGKSISPRQPKEETAAKNISPRNNDLLEQQSLTSRTNNLPTASVENNLALIFPGQIDNVQYALLIPTTPLNLPTARTENRILTPTSLRDRKFCDSSTQTEESSFACRESSVKAKLTNQEVTYDNRSRKERRSRSESLEERPKWGVNRPPTRYVKQSEKDPLYQRRKSRQKLREIKTYGDKNSSDDTPSPSPRLYRKKECSRSHRRNKEMLGMYRSEMVPLECDKDHIYYKRSGCCCLCRCGRHRCSGVDVLKIDTNSPRDRNEKLPELEVDDNSDAMDKLSSLHNGLLIKRDRWENTPTTPEFTTWN